MTVIDMRDYSYLRNKEGWDRIAREFDEEMIKSLLSESPFKKLRKSWKYRVMNQPFFGKSKETIKVRFPHRYSI